MTKAGEGFKIRLRFRRGYVREAGGHTSWSEYQVVAGRRVVGRFELLDRALKEYPCAMLDVSVTHAMEIAAKNKRRRT